MTIIIVVSILVLFFGFGHYNASKLQHIHIQETVIIRAERQKVFDQVAYLKNFPQWSPFKEADPEQKIEIKGVDGKVGAQYHWEGNNGKDLGYQEIKEIKPLEYIKMKCDIQKPFNAQPIFEYSFATLPNGIRVTQDFYLKSGMVDAFFMWLFGAKKEMQKMNKRGMELLRITTER